MTLYLKRLQNFRPSKLAVKKNSQNPTNYVFHLDLRIEIASLREAWVQFPAGANFEGQQLCSALAYKNVFYLFGYL